MYILIAKQNGIVTVLGETDSGGRDVELEVGW